MSKKYLLSQYFTLQTLTLFNSADVTYCIISTFCQTNHVDTVVSILLQSTEHTGKQQIEKQASYVIK